MCIRDSIFVDRSSPKKVLATMRQAESSLKDGVSLKDAVGIFGGGCTGEIISPEAVSYTQLDVYKRQDEQPAEHLQRYRHADCRPLRRPGNHQEQYCQV